MYSVIRSVFLGRIEEKTLAENVRREGPIHYFLLDWSFSLGAFIILICKTHGFEKKLYKGGAMAIPLESCLFPFLTVMSREEKCKRVLIDHKCTQLFGQANRQFFKCHNNSFKAGVSAKVSRWDGYMLPAPSKKPEKLAPAPPGALYGGDIIPSMCISSMGPGPPPPANPPGPIP